VSNGNRRMRGSEAGGVNMTWGGREVGPFGYRLRCLAVGWC
jgi:hypothetical protein